MPSDDGTPGPSDDELPPDPFPGDPFADAPASPSTSSSAPSDANTGPDLAALLGMLGGEGGLGGLGGGALGAGMGGGLGALGSLFAALGSNSGLAWDGARQAAIWGAAGGSVEPNVEPLERIRLDELVRRVAPVVSSTAGLDIEIPSVAALTRAGWAAQALEDHRPLLERLAKAGGKPVAGSGSGESPLAGVFAMLGPTLTSTSIGALFGELGATALGTFDVLPIPRPGRSLTVVPSTVAAFANEWSIPLETATTHAVASDLAAIAVFSVPHVRSRLTELLQRWAELASFDVEALEGRIESMIEGMTGEINPASMAANAVELSGAGGLGPNAAQLAMLPEFERLLAPVLGFIDDVTMVSGARLLGDNRQVFEAWRRRRSSHAQLASMFGIADTSALAERGAAFLGGVMQRAGRAGLEALWTSPDHLPTAAELDAPGLWLARLELS